MGRYPRCRQFISEDAPKYPALEVRAVAGKAPVFYFLDAFGDTLKEMDIPTTLTREDIAQVLADHGITESTPKPVYKEKGFDGTAACTAFRRVDVQGNRLAEHDRLCEELVYSGQGIGYCECKGKGLRSIKIKLHSERKPFTCQNVCLEQTTPWGETIFEDDVPNEEL